MFTWFPYLQDELTKWEDSWNLEVTELKSNADYRSPENLSNLKREETQIKHLLDTVSRVAKRSAPSSQSLEEECQCFICLELSNQPLFCCQECAHIICQECLNKMLQKGPTQCPMCRKRFSKGVNPVRNKHAERMVKRLKMDWNKNPNYTHVMISLK